MIFYALPAFVYTFASLPLCTACNCYSNIKCDASKMADSSASPPMKSASFNIPEESQTSSPPPHRLDFSHTADLFVLILVYLPPCICLDSAAQLLQYLLMLMPTYCQSFSLSCLLSLSGKTNAKQTVKPKE